MFISVKRHEREKQEFIAAGNRVTDALLKCTAQGFFLLNAKGRILPPVSSAMTTLFQCKDFSNLSFEKLLAPLVSVKALTATRGFLAELLSAESTPPSTATAELSGDGTMRYEIDVRLAKPDGSSDALHYSFEFDPVDTGESRTWLVRVTDHTLHVQTVRDLTDLRLQFQTQREILRAILQKGETRFSGFLVKADASMKTIAAVMKKPSREDAAFRQKLDQMLDEVDRIRREAAAFHFSALENAARSFEDALHELRKRAAMSGSDFLPLTVKSDQLYNAFDLIKSVAAAAGPIRDSEGSLPAPSMTTGGTLIIEAPKFSSESAVPATSAAERPVSAGSLDGALLALTEHVAHEHNKQVVLESTGLHLVPPGFQAAIKNIAIQLIRNAVMHGIETPASRLAAGKPPTGLLRLEFRPRAEYYELLFEDDGCGLVPEDVRATAVARGIITAAAAERMRDREAIKLIFRSRYTTLGKDADGARHGNGMSLVRRYVHDAGGKIALASLAGYETRFKITLPAAAPPAEFPEAEARVA
jgi:signal transduction histidine kinase